MIAKPTFSIEDYELCNKLKSMRFSGMAEVLEQMLSDPNAELLPFREKIQYIIDAEWNLRYTKKLNRFIKKATLKYPAADLDDTLYDPERQLDVHIIEQLSKCEWIEQGKNLIITGSTKKDGCLNKMFCNIDTTVQKQLVSCTIFMQPFWLKIVWKSAICHEKLYTKRIHLFLYSFVFGYI